MDLTSQDSIARSNFLSVSLLEKLLLFSIIITFLHAYLFARLGVRVAYVGLVFDLLNFSLAIIYLIEIKFFSRSRIFLLISAFTTCYLFGAIKFKSFELISFSIDFSPGLLSVFSAFYSSIFLFKSNNHTKFIKIIVSFVFADALFYVLTFNDIKYDFFKYASYNFTSSLILFLLTSLTAIKYRVENYIVLWPSVLSTLFMLYLADARSSLALSLLFFLVCMRFKFLPKKLVYDVVFLLLLFVLIFLLFQELYQIYLVTRFATEGLDSPRWTMVIGYIQRIDFYSFFWGVDLKDIPMIVNYDLNPHNSFLRLHSLLGFPAIALLVFFLLSSFLNFSKVKSFLVLMFYIVLVRSAFDTLIFPGMLSIFFFIVFHSFTLDKATSPLKIKPRHR